MLTTSDLPQFPGAAALKNAEQVVPGSGRLLVEGYLKAIESRDDRLRMEIVHQHEMDLRKTSNQRLATYAGMCLGAFTLAVLAYAIHKGQDMTALSVALASVAGIAGVLLWGYRPRIPSNGLQNQTAGI